ncbi:MAG TPA: DNA-binding response regulator [Flavobacteriaceae bacterium]|nr:DNA-binding response regulator [Flavobacteriaceae bacterium]
MRNLLIVEDEIIIAEGIKGYLEQNGYSAKIATTGKQAIDFLKTQGFDAVVCDINLQEEINGIELVKKHHRQEQHGPVVFLTAYSNSEIMESAENLFPYAYIIKPFYNKQVLTTLNLAIANTQHDKASSLSKKQEHLAEQLSRRETEILEQLALGKTNKEIGESLFISKHTVDTHIRNIKEKLGLHKKGELIKFVLLNNAG